MISSIFWQEGRCKEAYFGCRVFENAARGHPKSEKHSAGGARELMGGKVASLGRVWNSFFCSPELFA